MEIGIRGKIREYYLMPSALFVHTTAHEIKTVLGSCVAVCLYDVKKQYGGMNHFMLPVWNDQGLATPKYGNVSTNRLIDKMINLGSEKRDLVAKVFGGANGLSENSVYEIGKRNIAVAYEILERNNIPILKADTGGVRGRKILMHTATNKILLKYI